MLVQLAFPPTVYMGSNLFLLTLVFLVFFDNGHPESQYEVLSHCAFDLHFPVN